MKSRQTEGGKEIRTPSNRGLCERGHRCVSKFTLGSQAEPPPRRYQSYGFLITWVAQDVPIFLCFYFPSWWGPFTLSVIQKRDPLFLRYMTEVMLLWHRGTSHFPSLRDWKHGGNLPNPVIFHNTYKYFTTCTFVGIFAADELKYDTGEYLCYIQGIRKIKVLYVQYGRPKDVCVNKTKGNNIKIFIAVVFKGQDYGWLFSHCKINTFKNRVHDDSCEILNNIFGWFKEIISGYAGDFYIKYM